MGLALGSMGCGWGPGIGHARVMLSWLQGLARCATRPSCLMPGGEQPPRPRCANASPDSVTPCAAEQIRESIKSLFPDRDCFTLVRPVADEAALRGLGTLPREELRPEFVQVGSGVQGRW